MFFLDCDKYCKRRESVIVNAIPTGGPKPLANVGMEISPIVIVDVIKPVSTKLVIVLNGFIFLLAL